jgi:hypothetical protein
VIRKRLTTGGQCSPEGKHATVLQLPAPTSDRVEQRGLPSISIEALKSGRRPLDLMEAKVLLEELAS